jgi:hypothetical protein
MSTKRTTAVVTIDDVEYVVCARVERYPSDPVPFVDFVSVVQDGQTVVDELPEPILARLEQASVERAAEMAW